MKWQCSCQLLNVALGDDSDGSNGPCTPDYGLVRLVSVGHYPVVCTRLATDIPVANYAGMKDKEWKIINSVTRVGDSLAP